MKKNVLYKSRLKYGLWLAGGMALVSACTDNLVNETLPWEKTLDLQAVIQQENVTRVNDNGFADGDQIGVFVVNYDGESASPELQLTGNHADNVRFTYDDTSYRWTGSYQLYWKDEKTPVDVYGYYPFISQLSSITEQPFSVEQNQRDTPKGETLNGYEKSDFLWAKTENITPTDAVITLNHNHIMAGIEVALVEGYGFDENEWENSECNILVQNVALAGTVNLRDGSVTCTGSSEHTGIIPQKNQGKYRAIVLPQTVQAGASLFSITIAGKAIEFVRQKDMEYYRGKLHKFTIEVNKSLETGDYELNLLSDGIVNWENDPLSHNGTAREYITVHINEGEYLGDVIKNMGIEDPSLIKNLKLTGCISRVDNFAYIHEHMPYLEAIHMKELRTKNMPSYNPYEWNKNRVDKYGQPYFADDYLPGDGGTSDPDDTNYGTSYRGRAAFEHMIFLQYVVWPDNLKGIGDHAFAGCPLRGSLVFPEGVKHIGNNAFVAYSHKANNLTGELYIPSSVEYIGNEAIGRADNNSEFSTYLTGELVLPHRMKFLGNAFKNCPRLTGQIRIPDGLTELNKFAAPQMTGDVIIPQGIKKINGLGGNPSSIYIPEGVEEISNDAFRGLSSLKGDIKIPKTVKTIGTAAFRGTSISHISLPEKLEIISDELLLGCKFLQDTLTIPSSVTQIRSWAFEDCNMNAIILPESLQQIWGNALNRCYSLDFIQCKAEMPPTIEDGRFEGIQKNNITLVVPEGSVDAYRNAPGWNEFKRISAYRNFVCRPMKARLLNKADTRTVILNADGNWKMTHSPSWMHVDKTSGSKKTELSVSIDAMAHGSADRTDSVVFTLQDKVDEDGNPITCYYKVEQFDYQHDEDSQLQLQRHTKGRGINIVFIGDGYDAKDISKENYLNDVREGMEYFFAIEPYKTYKDYFDVYVDFPLSYESGVCSNVNIWHTTKFDTTYGAGVGGRLKVNFDDMMSYVLNDVTGTVVTGGNVNQTSIITILNSDVYEGLTCLWATGAAIAAVPHSRYGYPNDYRGLIQHEAGGHGFGKLDDEYVYHREHIRKCPCTDGCTHAEAVEEAKNRGWSRNVSLIGKYKDVEWRHLIFDDRYQDIVDIYEGACMHSGGIYRSEVNSCMNNNVPYYSTISRQAIVERIMDYAGETFNFENFVAKDGREMGDKFLTRSGSAGSVSVSIKGNMPEIVKSSPLKNLKRKVKYNIKKQQAR